MTRAIQYCTLSRPLLEILVPRALGLYIAQTGGCVTGFADFRRLDLRICVTWMCGFAWLGLADFRHRTWLPVGHAGFVERHEVDLAGGASLGAWEEYLQIVRRNLGQGEQMLEHQSSESKLPSKQFLTVTLKKAKYLVISLTQELEFLCLLVHEHPVQVSSLNSPET